MKNRTLLLLFSLILAIGLQAQASGDSIQYSLNANLHPGFGKNAPFLSTANQFDRYSFQKNSLNLWATLHKKMNADDFFDYGFGAELDGNLSSTGNRFFPGECYVEGKTGFLKTTLGMKRNVYGDQDSLLSSGGMLWSKNSRPFPGIAVESDDYVKVPFTLGLLEVKGGITHAWFTDSTETTHTLLHYKYGFIRLGGHLPVNIHYGLHHAAQWSGNSPTFGSSPANWSNFKRVFLGDSGDSNSPGTEQYNALGNHILSKNLGLDLNLRNFSASFYWQNIYEDGPIKLMYETYNIEDGLWGTSLKFKKFKPLSRLVFEYMSTTDQSGPWHDLDGIIYGGIDSYYNNGVYNNGWSFYGMTVGNPWLTSPRYNENGDIRILNNKVRLYYLAGMGQWREVSYQAKLAYSRNWGSPNVLYPEAKKQVSYQLETIFPIHSLSNTRMSLGISGDKGSMYGTNFAFLMGISYFGNF